MSTIKINTCDKDWFGKDYIFYDSDGSPININYDEELDMYRGKLYFDSNSSDTFKSLELNLFERVRGFEYSQYTSSTSSIVDELYTKKFQLFNTEGIDFYGGNTSINITKILAVNNRADYYSKWIFGDNIDIKFKIGDNVKFSSSIFGISDRKVFTILGKKRGAVLILTDSDNSEFNNNFGGSLTDPSQYGNITIQHANVIKFRNYISRDYTDIYPEWSEPKFYSEVTTGQKINIINSNNQGVYTILDKSTGDDLYLKYGLDIDDFDGNLTIEVSSKTTDYTLYTGDVEFSSLYNTITIKSDISPLVKSNDDIYIQSASNNNVLTIAPIPNFSPFNTFYSDGNGITPLSSQVVYNNAIYNCIQSYTQSGTSSITPIDTTYWERSRFLKIVQSLNDENLNSSIILVGSVKLEYLYDSNLSSRTNLAKCFSDLSDEFSALNLTSEMGKNNGYIVGQYPGNYFDVKFIVSKEETFTDITTNGSNFSPTNISPSYIPYSDIKVSMNGVNILLSDDAFSTRAYGYFINSSTSSAIKLDRIDTGSEFIWKDVNSGMSIAPQDDITLNYKTKLGDISFERVRVVETEEQLVNERNRNLSELTEERIVLTDIDEYGLKITINSQIYDIDSTIIYDNQGDIDLPRSIDATIKNWIFKYKKALDIRGIFIKTERTNSIFDDTILIRGVFPNVFIEISVSVGSTADFYIPDSQIVFYKMGSNGSNISISVNNITYIQQFTNSINNTLSKWVDTHSPFLLERGIIVDNLNSTILFKKKEDIDIDLSVYVGELFVGEVAFDIIRWSKGNEGLIITSNKIVHNNQDINFEEECFSTGQIIGINDSPMILNNQEYNIIQLNPNEITLSYQGAFFGSDGSQVERAFFNPAFGDDYNIGDIIDFTFDNNYLSGTITSVSPNYYQVVSNGRVYSLSRLGAFS